MKRTRILATSLFQRLTRPIYLTLVLVMVFGFSMVGKAAQKLKRIARGTKGFLRSSQSAHLLARPWGYFRSTWDKEERSGDDLPAPVARQERITNDPSGRIESELKVPSALEGRVNFWIEVYSRFSSQYRIVHDRTNPAIIYGYLDLRQIYRSYANPRTAESKAYQVEKRFVAELKDRMLEAAAPETQTPKLPTPEELKKLREFLADAGAKTPDQIATLVRNVRTQTGQRDHFVKAIKRSKKYLPQIEEYFRAEGLPIGLARLPFVESSFNTTAVSKTGAIGMWQFMPDTARIFNRTGTRKEWADPLKQSKSAARLFRSMHKVLPDWGMAVTGYNSGPMRLVRLGKKYNTSSIVDLINVPSTRDTLGFAGKNFFCELLAANLVEQYRDKLFPAAVLEAPSIAFKRKLPAAGSR